MDQINKALLNQLTQKIGVMKGMQMSDEEIEKSFDKSELDLIEKAVIENDIEKGGTRAVLGEIRKFGGRDYIKTHDGWKFHGKGTGAKAQSEKKEVSKNAKISEMPDARAKVIKAGNDIADSSGYAEQSGPRKEKADENIWQTFLKIEDIPLKQMAKAFANISAQEKFYGNQPFAETAKWLSDSFKGAQKGMPDEYKPSLYGEAAFFILDLQGRYSTDYIKMIHELIAEGGDKIMKNPKEDQSEKKSKEEIEDNKNKL